MSLCSFKNCFIWESFSLVFHGFDLERPKLQLLILWVFNGRITSEMTLIGFVTKPKTYNFIEQMFSVLNTCARCRIYKTINLAGRFICVTDTKNTITSRRWKTYSKNSYTKFDCFSIPYWNFRIIRKISIHII